MVITGGMLGEKRESIIQIVQEMESDLNYQTVRTGFDPALLSSEIGVVGYKLTFFGPASEAGKPSCGSTSISLRPRRHQVRLAKSTHLLSSRYEQSEH